MDYRTLGLVLIVLALLGSASIVASLLQRQSVPGMDPLILDKFCSRLRGWWLFLSLVAAAMLLGNGVVVFLFGGMSFWAMREFITLTPTRPADHRPLFLVFFICIPLQFLLVWLELYDVYSVLIPTYVFLLIPIFMAIFGDTKRYLERVAQISAALLICVYCLSYAPALLTLESRPEEVPSPTSAVEAAAVSESVAEGAARGSASLSGVENAATGAGLLCFFLLMTQLTEIFQYVSLQFVPTQHCIAPSINTSRTWEGLATSCLGVMLAGTLLYWATPFPFWLAGIMSFVIAVMSFGGSLTLSAIKRDRGVRDYGTLVVGHGGILDRIDTICFSAPIFFHLTKMYLYFATAATPGDVTAMLFSWLMLYSTLGIDN
ncbi:MAG: phosphatidate cytidylyltransferase [Planctomycetia bacterium]|nr:phosphatidate cytidylyltransferase [Planctomycetia bacterium]